MAKVALISHIEALDSEHSWHLSQEQKSAYASALCHYTPDHPSKFVLQMLITNYHADHALVNALQAGDDGSWTELYNRITAIVATRFQYYTRDEELPREDMVQMVGEEIYRALPSYCYASRFLTWMYAVAFHTIQRHQRFRRAAKRSGSVESLDVLGELADVPTPSTEHPETVTDDKALLALVDGILAAQSAPRLGEIFRMWFVEDMRLWDIGERVKLDPSRVSTLLKQVRQILRSHPAIREWADWEEAGPEDR